MNTTEVENFPDSFRASRAPELMENIGQQAERFGTDIRYQDVEKVTGDVKKGSPLTAPFTWRRPSS